jgi:hypothetical protein
MKQNGMYIRTKPEWLDKVGYAAERVGEDVSKYVRKAVELRMAAEDPQKLIVEVKGVGPVILDNTAPMKLDQIPLAKTVAAIDFDKIEPKDIVMGTDMTEFPEEEAVDAAVKTVLAPKAPRVKEFSQSPEEREAKLAKLNVPSWAPKLDADRERIAAENKAKRDEQRAREERLAAEARAEKGPKYPPIKSYQQPTRVPESYPDPEPEE